MAYIGRIPQVGNYFKLDAITTSSTATYNLLKGGVAYVPETAYHILVSLNGVIQSPIDAYTVSGSQIIFASSLSSSDTINFILVLGDTLAIGTPSDATVGEAQMKSTIDLSSKTLTLPSASVTAHVTQYDDSAIRADISALALREATNESSAAFNLPNSFIETFTDDTNLGTQTDGDRASGYWSTIVSGNCFTNDSNTKFLLQSNTTNGSTTFTDESGTGLTITVAGDTQHKTDQFKNGSSSIYFDGSGDQLYTSDGGSAIEDLNAGDFCVEMWLRKDSSFTYSDHNTFYIGTGYQWEWASGKLGFYNYQAFGDWTHTGESTAASSDAWHHYASVRQGNDHRFYVDGTQVNSRTQSGSTDFTDGIIRLGYHTSTSSRYFKGWIDSVRVSNVNRYPDGTTFTPPTGNVANATGTLIQSANTVGSAKTEVSGTILYKDEAGTATIGTDLKIYFTCDGGSNWVEAASYNAITPVYSSGIKQVRLGKTTCTSGTDIRYKAVWANQASGSKETQLHGIGINY